MLDPQFLAQIRSYLNESGNRALDAGIGSLISPQMAQQNAPAAALEDVSDDPLSSGIKRGIGAVMGHHKSKKNQLEKANMNQEFMPVPMQMLTPPSGYRPGYDPEFNYGIGNPQSATAIRAYNATLPHNQTQHMVSGGTVSTGNAVADKAIAEGNQSVIRNQEAAATYAAMDNARDGTPIPEHLQQRLDARSSSGNSAMDRNDYSPSSGFNNPASSGGRGNGLFGGLGNLLTGHIAGYQNYGDMINGGGKYGSRDMPNTNNHPTGLRAMGQDLKNGGLGALLRDSFDGGGYGASGPKFKGGIRSLGLNILGADPVAFDQRFLGTEANDYGTKGTEGTRPMPRPRGMAEGGMTSDPMSGQGANEKDIISQAVSAIKGEVEDPRQILAQFVAQYGEDALRNLVDKVESGDMEATAQASQGHLKGPGDGMSDMIPASNSGNDVLLSDGEYVVPADVVSGLGNGSSDAGAKHLDEMMARVRQQRTGSKEQAKQINPKQAMPA